MIDNYIKFVRMTATLGNLYGCIGVRIWLHRVTDITASGYGYYCIGVRIWLHRVTDITA